MRRRLRPRDGAAPRPILATTTKLRAPRTSSLPAIGSYTINGRGRTRWWPPIADAGKVLWWRPPPAHHVRFAHPDEEPQLLWPREVGPCAFIVPLRSLTREGEGLRTIRSSFRWAHARWGRVCCAQDLAWWRHRQYHDEASIQLAENN
jgi:hypothetical protein